MVGRTVTPNMRQNTPSYELNSCSLTRCAIQLLTILTVVFPWIGCGPAPEGEQCDICPVKHAIIAGQVTRASGGPVGRIGLVVSLARVDEPDNSLTTVIWETESNGVYTREVTNSNLGPFFEGDSIRTTVVVRNDNFETLGQASRDGLTFRPIHEIPDTLRIDVTIQ